MSTSFKVPCPSCEAPVLIKNPNLVGTKVECPKCKYRFKVEQPAELTAEAGKADANKADAKNKKPNADKTKTKATGGKKELVPILVGVGAVVVLVVVGAMMFGGDGKKPGYTGGPNNTGGTGNTDPEEKKEEPKKVDPGPPPIPFSTKNTTHLLPGKTVAVYRFNMDQLRQSPLYSALADEQIRKMFEYSMGFPMEDVETYIHCFSGEERVPFGVLKLKTPSKPPETIARMRPTLEGKPKTLKGRDLHTIRLNPFVSAVAHALSMSSLVGEFYDRVPMARSADVPAKPMGVCVYDTQHILMGDLALLDQFLGSLDTDGYPPFQTAMVVAPVAPPKVEPGKDNPAPTTPPKTPTPPITPPSTGDKPYTSVDTYRSLEFPLKKALDDLEADRRVVPMFVYAEKFDLQHYDPKLIKKDYALLAGVLDPIAARTRYISANIVNFSERQLLANLRLTLNSSEDSRTLAKDQLGPALARLSELLQLYLTTPVQFRDYTQGGSTTTPNSGLPPDGMGGTGDYQPPMPMGPGSSQGPPPMGPGSSQGPMPKGPGSSQGPPPMGPGSSQGPPPKGPPRGPGKFGPGDPMGPPMGPGTGPGMEPDPKTPDVPPSHVDLGMIDNQLLIAINLNWTDTTNRTAVAPRLVNIANQIKGKMAIFSSEFSWHAVAAAGPKAEMATKAFPRGTYDRKSNQDRLGLAYPPLQRVSFYAELLPYLGRGPLAQSINKNLAWYDEKNLPAAGAWVPELLVPYYPQTAWRANSPYTPDHVLGATNYVGIAGVGLDIARENPNSPEFKKKVGMTGYGWGSKAEEVTDGLSNTIYLMQTPPGLQQPWIAGGGATVRGFDETDPMAAFKYTHPGKTKQGTYALMGDGSVRWVPADIDPKVLHAMATRAGGESLADINKDAPRIDPPKVEPKPKPEPEPEPTGAVELAPPPREKK